MTAPTGLRQARLVVDEVLHDGGVIVFRGQSSSGAAVRCVASRSLLGCPPERGEAWLVAGAWQEHPVYGQQLAVRRARLLAVSGELVVQTLATHDAFPGIGRERAARLWSAFGLSLFDALERGDADPFRELLGDELAQVFVRGWAQLHDLANTLRWLTEQRFPAALGRKVAAIYGALPIPDDVPPAERAKGPTVWHLEDDPYRLLAFASWSATDTAARRLGVHADDPRRAAGAVEAALTRELARGHTWATFDTVRARAQELLHCSREGASAAISEGLRRGGVVQHGGGLQLAGTYVMERFVESRVGEMVSGQYVPAQRQLRPPLSPESVAHVIDRFEASEGYTLQAEQRAAVWMAMQAPFSTLSGGPGVGKTTVLKAIHAAAEAHGIPVIQAALSGRAAQRMAEATHRRASTIAALVRRLEQGEVPLSEEPLLIIDEASMVDLATLYRLMVHFVPGVRLLLVGDVGQLPPVSFGLTFHVFVGAPSVSTTALTRVMRQTEASGIPQVCAAIRRGEVPILAAPDWSRGGVSFVPVPPDQVTDAVLGAIARMGGVSRDVQVVGSVKRGRGAVVDINHRLQALRCPGKAQVAAGLFVDDPVIVTRNDYEVGVMNGELGIVREAAADGGLVVDFDGELKLLPAHLAGKVELAYAITCHKSQGSQFRRVVVPVTPSRLLDRTLLLTAVSRAQEQVVLVGDHDAFAAAVRAAPQSSVRKVGLAR